MQYDGQAVYRCVYVAIVAVLALNNCVHAQQLHRKFEYKHSFRAPKLAQPDGTIPFWEISGDAIASPEQLRLVPSMRSRKGAIWNKRQFIESDWFELEMQFKVTGQGRIGADGLALWYTAQKGTIGNVFGSNDYWTGLGLVFDSFDNDNQRNNPYISLMVNDGTRMFDHQTDGSQQVMAGCQKDFRNRPFPVKVRVTYYKNVVTVMVHDGMSQTDRFEMCIRSENVMLPKNGFFGLSAATGGLADDHDILAFSATSLHTEAPVQPASMPEQERRQAEEEYQRQYQQYQQEHDKFKKEHPDRVRVDDEDYEKYAKLVDDANTKELRLIYESQEAIRQIMQNIDNRIVQVQQQQTNLVSQVQAGRGQATGQVAPATGGEELSTTDAPIDTFNRAEANEVISIVRELQSGLRDMRNYVNEIYTKTHNMEQRAQAGGGQQQQQQQQQGVGTGSVQQAGGGTGDAYTINLIRQHVEGIKVDVEQLRQSNLAGQGGPGRLNSCPTNECLGATAFYVVIALQSCVIVGLLLFKKGQDKAKFY